MVGKYALRICKVSYIGALQFSLLTTCIGLRMNKFKCDSFTILTLLKMTCIIFILYMYQERLLVYVYSLALLEKVNAFPDCSSVNRTYR